MKALNALSKLASNLRSSMRTMWRIAKITNRITKYTFGKYSKFATGGSSLILLRLLPFIPPVLVGIYVLFSAFWPQRILFFSASQRRRFMNQQKWHWIMFFFLLIVALLFNTVLINELEAAFNNSVPFLDIYIKRKLGWKISVAASAFAMASAFSFFINYWILENYTYKNPSKIERTIKMKYEKEQFAGWNWLLPIFICTIACGLGVLANFYPRFNMVIEPKGKFGQAIETVLNKISVYEYDMKKVKQQAAEECLPFATFTHVLTGIVDNRKHLLMPPINNFFNQTNNVVQPLKEVVTRTRRQLITDLGDIFFDEDTTKKIKELDQLNFQYLGSLFIVPRLIQLIILIFAMLTTSCPVWRGTILSSFQPKIIVNVFGKMCMFSFVYCILTQVSIYNILTDLDTPLYRISISWGLGFMYDMASEAFMWSIWLGMNNPFFFTM